MPTTQSDDGPELGWQRRERESNQIWLARVRTYEDKRSGNQPQSQKSYRDEWKSMSEEDRAAFYKRLPAAACQTATCSSSADPDVLPWLRVDTTGKR